MDAWPMWKCQPFGRFFANRNQSRFCSNRIPIPTLASSGPKVMILLVVATGALPLTLPSFFEIPISPVTARRECFCRGSPALC